jgi:isopentenyl-diphosphate delta-isomerase
MKNAGRQRLGELFWDWGISTAVSIVEASQSVSIPIIGSGGVRSGIDVAKSLVLGSSLSSLSHPVLSASINGVEETEAVLSQLIDELRNVMFLVGAKSVQALRESPVVVVGKTAEWLRTRGFDLDSLARRGMG